MAFFDCEGVRLLLSTPEHAGESKSDSSVLYFKVSDIEDAHAQLKTKGVVFRDKPHLIARMPDHELWMTFFHDTEQNLHALMAELPQSAG